MAIAILEKGDRTSQFYPNRDRVLPDTQKPPALPDIENLKRDRDIYRDKNIKVETTLILKPRHWLISFLLLLVTIVFC